jgi:outer membrane receptor protein involved in Fe transport
MRISSDRGIGPTASFLDPFLLTDVEIVRGASGVAWGSGAMGGVISTGLGAAPAEPRGALKLSASTNGDGRLAAGRAGGPLGRGFRATAGAFLRLQDDYEFPDSEGVSAGEALNSGFENGGGMLALEREVSGGSFRLATLVTSASDIGRPTLQERRLDTIVEEDHALVSGRFARGAADSRTEFGVAWHRPWTLNRSERFGGDGSPSRTEDVSNGSHDFAGSWLIERPWSMGSWLVGGDAFGRLSVQSDETTVRYAGGAVSSTEAVEPIRDGRQVDVGTFLGWKHAVGATGQWMIAGRLDLANRTASERSSVDEIAPSLNASIVFPIHDALAAAGSVGRTFRAPRLQELYFAGSRPAGYRLANPGLVPETAWSAETGLRGTWGRWSADAEVWGMVVRDLIVQLPISADSDTLRFENESTGKLAGLELEVAWRDGEGRGEATLGASWVRGVDEDGAALPDVPPHVLRIASEWRVLGRAETRSAKLRGALRAGGAKTPLALGEDARWWSEVLGTSGVGGDEAPIPGFAHVDAGVLLRIAPRVALDVAIANAFDSRYIDRPESDAYPQPGRAFQIELTLGQ